MIVGVDNFTSGFFKNLNNFRGIFLNGDITDRDFWNYLDRNFKFDLVFHQAAITDTTVEDQSLMVEVNTNAYRYLLDFALERWSAKVVYASSAAVYGNCPAPMVEDGCKKPENVYGFSKLMMDRITENLLRENPNLPLVGLRYFNVYGPNEAHKGRFASMVYQLIVKIARGERPRLFKWGEQKRDFVYVKDVVKANLLAAEKDVSGIFNVGSGRARSFNELLEIINKTLGTSAEVEYIDNPYPFYQNHTEADLTRAKTALGYEPEWALERGVADYIKHLKKAGLIP